MAGQVLRAVTLAPARGQGRQEPRMKLRSAERRRYPVQDGPPGCGQTGGGRGRLLARSSLRSVARDLGRSVSGAVPAACRGHSSHSCGAVVMERRWISARPAGSLASAVPGVRGCGGAPRSGGFRDSSGSHRTLVVDSGSGSAPPSDSAVSPMAYLLSTMVGPAVPPTVDSIQTVPGLAVPAAALRSRRA
jgi:hypothetical protein